MGLTRLSRNILLAVVLIILLNVYTPPVIPEAYACWTMFLVSCSLFFGAIYATPKQGGKTEGTMDKALINLDRFFDGKAPTAGQIGAVCYFRVGEVPTVEEGKEAMQRLADKHIRMRTIPVPTPNMIDSYWTTPNTPFDISDHVKGHDAVKGGVAELNQKANEIINTLVSWEHPLWSIDILNIADPHDTLGVEGEDDIIAGAVIIRIHHSIGDGLRLVGAWGEVMRFKDGSPATLELLSKMSAKKLKPPRPNLLTLPFKFLADFVTAATLDQMKPEPTTPVHKSDTLLPIEQPRSTYTSWVPFQYVKDIRAAHPGATVNDVILTAFCGAIRTYCTKRGQPISSDSVMRAMCAFSMPDRGKGKLELYNDFLMPSMSLPANVEGREERIAAVKKVMAGLKTSLVGFIQERLVLILGALGLDAMIKQSQVALFKKHSFVYSNVPGFEKDVYLFAERCNVHKISVYYPNVLSQAIFLTFRGSLGFSLVTDRGELPEFEMLVDSFVEEIKSWRNDVMKKKE
mmetsp:Transcript_4670/g.7000  ORF Transcript_4670/g.7000 Transcript_4670/m.7000 type:complete len:516 (-) Transcript_4670:25-1572(-)|eukprot:CAMPEP_0201521546 /NCGR_PEP_ID=MMETSP0161_2-20130828/14770_1 /ASSEMBLY_ACC=CAM_ASM_000251 /TAXON_ID=180227 /ORGANISM="Neoparamoeba aestuarina, Strain SoJaBio B1-5/56/2" /LENGTH=515 /DNA_ID=CAMNT_0047920199 /DNA_START=87 /DNA_END=1634 /DNA_ORIENTATION=+